MNIYYKFVLLLVLSFLLFSCEKQDIEKESVYGEGVLAITSSNLLSSAFSSDIVHFAKDGTITYDLFRKNNNNDSIRDRVSSIYEGKNNIYLIGSSSITVLDKSTFVKKNIISSVGGITKFTYIEEHETVIVANSAGERLLVQLPEGQVLKDLTDKNYIRTKYNSDKNEVLGFVVSSNNSCRIDHLEATTLNKMPEIGGFRNFSHITPNEMDGAPSTGLNYFLFDKNDNVWRQSSYRYDFTFRLYRYYFEVMVRQGSSSENLSNYLQNRKIYQLTKNNERDLYTYNISKRNNTFYYRWGKDIKKIKLSNIDDNVYEIRSPLSSLTGNEPALEELATPFITFDDGSSTKSININEKNGDIILFTSKPVEDSTNDETQDNLIIYDETGRMKYSYKLLPNISGRGIKLVSPYSHSKNHLIFID